MELIEVVTKIKGKAGTNVKIKIKRGNMKLTYTVKRNKIDLNSVNYEEKTYKNKKIAYIEITQFGEKTYQEFIEATTKAINNNPDGFIIDLRNNPGGYLSVCLAMLDLFFDEKEIVTKTQKPNGKTKSYYSGGDGTLAPYKIVILINGGSASASEILTGALKDHKTATIIGETSFGKGSVQTLIQYDDGAQLKLTTAKWLTPNGTSINKKGIKPNKTVKNTEGKDSQLESALKEF